MKTSEKPLFIILMSLFFLFSLILTVKPVWGINLYTSINKILGFDIKHSGKAALIVRSLGVIMFVWGFVVIWLSTRQ